MKIEFKIPVDEVFQVGPDKVISELLGKPIVNNFKYEVGTITDIEFDMNHGILFTANITDEELQENIRNGKIKYVKDIGKNSFSIVKGVK